MDSNDWSFHLLRKLAINPDAGHRRTAVQYIKEHCDHPTSFWNESALRCEFCGMTKLDMETARPGGPIPNHVKGTSDDKSKV